MVRQTSPSCDTKVVGRNHSQMGRGSRGRRILVLIGRQAEVRISSKQEEVVDYTSWVGAKPDRNKTPLQTYRKQTDQLLRH